MGTDSVNVEFNFHGYGTSGPKNLVRVRLHYGDKSIDEYHDMGNNAVRTLMQDSLDNDKTDFQNHFETWFDNEASTAADVYKSDFLEGAWRAFP